MAYSIDLTGHVVVVTGGSKGIGAAISETFLQAGAHVEVCARNEPDSLPEVGGRSVVFTAVDVRDPDKVRSWIDGIAEKHGRIDTVINNAGGGPYADFADSSPKLIAKVNELNFLASAYVAHAAYPHLAKVDHSVLLNITSVSARRPSPRTAAYGAAKAALESLTKSLAVEWAPKVRVNALSLGLIATDAAVASYGNAEQYAAVASTIPEGRLARPEEVGAACLMMASPFASYTTGAILNVDGGGEWPAFMAHIPAPDPKE